MKNKTELFFKKILCCHKNWKVHATINVHWHEEDGGGIKERRQTLICLDCGKTKKIKL